MQYQAQTIQKLNRDIKTHFTHLFPIEDDFYITHSGVSRLVMLDRYSQKDSGLKTLGVGDVVLTIVKDDPKFPARGIGIIQSLDYDNDLATILLEEEWRGSCEDEQEAISGIIVRPFKKVDKPLEIYYEQIAKRVGFALANTEKNSQLKQEYGEKFTQQLRKLNVVPAGRVLYGAGSLTEVTYFNCFVMPFIHDSRGGIANHRKEVMEIMSRGGEWEPTALPYDQSRLQPKELEGNQVEL